MVIKASATAPNVSGSLGLGERPLISGDYRTFSPLIGRQAEHINVVQSTLDIVYNTHTPHTYTATDMPVHCIIPNYGNYSQTFHSQFHVWFAHRIAKYLILRSIFDNIASLH